MRWKWHIIPTIKQCDRSTPLSPLFRSAERRYYSRIASMHVWGAFSFVCQSNKVAVDLQHIVLSYWNLFFFYWIFWAILSVHVFVCCDRGHVKKYIDHWACKFMWLPRLVADEDHAVKWRARLTEYISIFFYVCVLVKGFASHNHSKSNSICIYNTI